MKRTLPAGRIILVLLLAFGAWWTNRAYQYQRLVAALRSENIPDALRALRRGAPPDGSFDVRRENSIHEYYTGETCLARAIEIGSPRAEPLVREMVRRGADPHKTRSYTAESNGWEIAFDRRDIALVRAMLEEGARPDAEDVASAVGRGRREIIALFLTRGASVHADLPPGYWGKNLLHVAASGGDVETAALLLERGLDINAHSKGMRETPLMEAVTSNHPEMVRYLLKRGARRDDRDDRGQTAWNRARESLESDRFSLEDARKELAESARESPEKRGEARSQVRYYQERVRTGRSMIELLVTGGR